VTRALEPTEEECRRCNKFEINRLAPEFYIYVLAHSVCKMLITQEPKKVAL
jgi:hypothetical protein